MSFKILIVEDQFLESNHLQIVLEKVGHKIFGIAKSVEEALVFLAKSRPDIVLVDILLKGEQTGIDLAFTLNQLDIPFVYLSANSNPSILEEAKLTNPYGFLVKPFRERDVLVSIDIAIYRYKQNEELNRRQEKWLASLLNEVLVTKGSRKERFLLFAKAFTSFLPFDFIKIDTKTNDKSTNDTYCFQRKGFDEYVAIEQSEAEEKFNLTLQDFYSLKKYDLHHNTALFLNGKEYIDNCLLNSACNKFRKAFRLRSKLWLPLKLKGKTELSVSFFCLDNACYNDEHLRLVSQLQDVIKAVIENIRDQKSNIGGGNTLLVPEVLLPSSIQVKEIVGSSPKLLEVLDRAIQIAPFDTNVLISGETGVGKDVLVHAIHQLSLRKFKTLIKVNCAAIPLNSGESEFFGHEKGAFIGAIARRIGKFEQANGGTLFLDEIGALPLDIQGKLLTAIQDKEIERVGGRTTIQTDVRIIVTTNRDLLKEVAEGRFRIDLYYRINVFAIAIPSLRERKGDIPALSNHFLKLQGTKYKTPPRKLSTAALQNLIDYSWPGNIRELQHVVEQHALLSKMGVIEKIEFQDNQQRIGEADNFDFSANKKNLMSDQEHTTDNTPANINSIDPISFERFINAIDKFEKLKTDDLSEFLAPAGAIKDLRSGFIFVRSDKKMVRVQLTDILYIEAIKQNLKIYTAKMELVSYETLSYFEEKLPLDLFIRIHRSFIVSLLHIHAYSAGEIEIAGRSLPIGSSYIKEVQRKLESVT